MSFLIDVIIYLVKDVLVYLNNFFMWFVYLGLNYLDFQIFFIYDFGKSFE